MALSKPEFADVARCPDLYQSPSSFASTRFTPSMYLRTCLMVLRHFNFIRA